MKHAIVFAFSFVALSLGSQATGFADDAIEAGVLADLPIREVTIFKDGHALVMHEGPIALEPGGEVVLRSLPVPVLGTFWAFSGDRSARLVSVTAGRREVELVRDATTLLELLEANIGAEVVVQGMGGSHHGSILALPEAPLPTLEGSIPAHSRPAQPPPPARLLILATEDGVRVIPAQQVQQITFPGEHTRTYRTRTGRHTLTLRLDRPAGREAGEASVGMMYLQNGLRWIPGYRLTIDGAGNAHVRLQATLINELADLDRVTAHLVIGVPTFEFHQTLDPIAIQGRVAELSSYFQSGRSGQALSQAMLGQMARRAEVRQVAPGEDGFELPEGEAHEDLYIFTIEGLSLKRDERMVVPVAEFSIPYEDVYTLDLPLAPPADLQRQVTSEQQRELARLLAQPKTMYVLRLRNTSPHPLTTAPAIIVRDDRVLAQGLMTYTPQGGRSDLLVTAAMDIRAQGDEEEVGRTPNAAEHANQRFARIDMRGRITVTNHKSRPVTVEVRRSFIGQPGDAGQGGSAQLLSMFEHADRLRRLSLPNWWNHANGLGQFTWELALEPGERVTLEYEWSYFWR